MFKSSPEFPLLQNPQTEFSELLRADHSGRLLRLGPGQRQQRLSSETRLYILVIFSRGSGPRHPEEEDQESAEFEPGSVRRFSDKISQFESDPKVPSNFLHQAEVAGQGKNTRKESGQHGTSVFANILQ